MAVATPAAGGDGAAAINRIGLTAAGMIGMISMIMTSTMVNVAIPDVMGAYGIGQDQAHWLATGFFAAMTVSMLLNGWLVGLFGARAVFLGAAALFSASCLLGQFAPGYGWVVAARFGQGMCAGLIQPLTMGTVFQAYPPSSRGTAMGWFGLGVVLGPTIGPAVGGLIVDNADWRYVFSAAVPLMLVAMALAGMYFPGRDARAHRVPMNFVSFTLIGGCIMLFLNGITTGQREGWAAAATFILLFGSAVCLTAFLIQETVSRHPLIQVRLFASRTYAASAGVGFMFGAGMFGSLYLTPIMVQTVQDFTATKAGMMLVPAGIVTMAVFPFAGWLTHKLPAVRIMVVGMIGFALSCYWLAGAEAGTGFWTLVWYVLVGRVGLALVMPALNISALAAVPPHLVNYGASTLNFIRMTGAAIGTNALAIIFDYRASVHGEGLLATQTPDNEATRALLDSLTARLAESGLPELERGMVAASYLSRLLARKANELAFHDGFTVLVVAFLAGGITAMIVLRRASPPGPAAAPARSRSRP